MATNAPIDAEAFRTLYPWLTDWFQRPNAALFADAGQKAIATELGRRWSAEHPIAVLDELRERSGPKVAEVVRVSKLRKYEPGEVIIQEGTYDSWVYFLVQGEVGIVHRGVELGRLRRLGDVFGEMGIIDGSPRSATVTALTPVVCLGMDASIFDRLKDQDRVAVQAAFYKVFCEILAARLRDMDKKVAECSLKRG